MPERRIPKVPLPLSATKMKVAMSDIDPNKLRAELDDFAEPEKWTPPRRSVIAGLRRYSGLSRNTVALQHGESRHFERLYSVRSTAWCALEEVVCWSRRWIGKGCCPERRLSLPQPKPPMTTSCWPN
jgi:hypothetical protein